MLNKSSDLDLGKLGAGLMQWGTSWIHNQIVNPKGDLTDDKVQLLWKTCRSHHIVFFDMAEGYGGGMNEFETLFVNGTLKRTCRAGPMMQMLWWPPSSCQNCGLGGDISSFRLCKRQPRIDLYFIYTPIHPFPGECFVQWACDAVGVGLIKEIPIAILT
jgi:hypothetical protein